MEYNFNVETRRRFDLLEGDLRTLKEQIRIIDKRLNCISEMLATLVTMQNTNEATKTLNRLLDRIPASAFTQK